MVTVMAAAADRLAESYKKEEIEGDVRKGAPYILAKIG
jgi:hypothetical protein